MSTLIIGTGQAGLELAAALRAAKHPGPITLIGAEAHHPYQRPPLSKGYLAGHSGQADLQLRTPTWYAERDITVLPHRRIEHIGWETVGSGRAADSTGTEHVFTNLALATGASPRRLQVPGAQLDAVHYLRTRADADRLAPALAPGARIVVIGGGFIGLEIAATASAAGCRVTVLEASDRLIGRAVCPQTSGFYARSLPERGIRVLTETKVAGLTGDTAVTGVRVLDADGVEQLIEADAVVVGIGVVPDTTLAGQLGLRVENGIVVDEGMRASDGRTIVVGDAANMPFPGRPRAGFDRLRLESVPNAIEQARVAAATLTGGREGYDATPWFWSDQGEVKLQIAGLSHGYTHTVLRGDPSEGKFSILYYLDGELIAADCVNQPRDFMAVKMALGKGVNLDPELARDPAVALRDLVKSAALAVSG